MAVGDQHADLGAERGLDDAANRPTGSWSVADRALDHPGVGEALQPALGLAHVTRKQAHLVDQGQVAGPDGSGRVPGPARVAQEHEPEEFRVIRAAPDESVCADADRGGGVGM